MSDPGAVTHYRACTLCEAVCGLEIRVADGRVVSIRGDREDPFSRGHVCPKGIALQDLQNDPDRLRKPLRRTGNGTWEEIGWNEALKFAAAGLDAVRQKHGPDAVAIYAGNPNSHNLGSMLYLPPLMRALGTRNRYSATSADQLPHHVAAQSMFGHQLLLPIPDLDRTAFLLMLGANPVVSNGSIMTAPGMMRRIDDLRKRGGRLVVIDPRRTETARRADRHLFIRPGTDALLLAALLHVIFNRNLASPGRLETFCTPLDPVREAVAPFSPDRVAAVTGIPASAISELAHQLAEAPKAVVYGRFGVSTQSFGGLCHWLINLLNIVTGNLDRPGGAMFTRPAFDLLQNVGPGGLGRNRTRVRDLPGFGGELPVAALAEEILTPGERQVRALLTVAGNPVLSTPDGRGMDAALAELDFMVSVDFYLNETTRHARVILPPTSPLEHDHYDLVFNLLAVRNGARYSKAVVDPEPGALDDGEILRRLLRLLDRGALNQRLKRTVMAVLGPRRILDLGLRRGPYGGGLRPGAPGLNLRRLETATHGLDLGPLEPCLPDRLRTPDRLIRTTSEPFLEDLPRLIRFLETSVEETTEDRSFLLIGRRNIRSNNSWMHNAPRLMRGRDRCTLLVHPDDIERLGLRTGDPVRVEGPGGALTVPIESSEDIMPGVVSLPHGWGHSRPGVRLRVAADRPGVSMNDLTDTGAVDPLCGTAVLNGIPVTLTPIAARRSTPPRDG